MLCRSLNSLLTGTVNHILPLLSMAPFAGTMTLCLVLKPPFRVQTSFSRCGDPPFMVLCPPFPGPRTPFTSYSHPLSSDLNSFIQVLPPLIQLPQLLYPGAPIPYPATSTPLSKYSHPLSSYLNSFIQVLPNTLSPLPPPYGHSPPPPCSMYPQPFYQDIHPPCRSTLTPLLRPPLFLLNPSMCSIISPDNPRPPHRNTLHPICSKHNPPPPLCVPPPPHHHRHLFMLFLLRRPLDPLSASLFLSHSRPSRPTLG